MASRRLLSPKFKKLISTSRSQSPSRESEGRQSTSGTQTHDERESVGACALSTSDSTSGSAGTSTPSDKDCVTKKRSVFSKFMSKKKSVLPKCSEVEEDPENEGHFAQSQDVTVRQVVPDESDPHLRLNRNISPVRQSSGDDGDFSTMGATTSGRTVRLSTRLLQLVPPPPSAEGVDEPPLQVGAGSTLNDVDDATGQLLVASLQSDSNSSPVGYPHVNFNRALSSSSSSTSSNSSSFPNPIADQSVTHGLVSTIYPQIDSVKQTVGAQAAHAAATTSHSQPGHMVHTQVDYQHCLVPDLLALTNSSCYWGVMDRYEAEQLLENKPEGTFLVRDSAQEEFLFSVSFRRYGRSLHARIEQWNHCFSFDSHDLGVFYSSTVCGLIEHYKDPNCCMFFEPMLTRPLCRTSPFTLQHLCRAIVTSHITYDDINLLQLPKSLHDYLKYYHYKQRVCVRRF